MSPLKSLHPNLHNIYWGLNLMSKLYLYLYQFYYCVFHWWDGQFFYFSGMKFIFQINISWLLFHNTWLICFCPSISVPTYEITQDRGKKNNESLNGTLDLNVNVQMLMIETKNIYSLSSTSGAQNFISSML